MDFMSPILTILTDLFHCTAKCASPISDLQENLECLRGDMRRLNRHNLGEGKGMRGREGRRKICGEEDGSLHVASQTKDMGNGEANTEPVGVCF